MTNCDMVEEMARAIREEQVRQYRDDDRGKCPDAAYYEEHVGPYALAQAAATIAKGRMEAIYGILTEAKRLILDGHPSRALLRVEEARAVIKDSPNVG